MAMIQESGILGAMSDASCSQSKFLSLIIFVICANLFPQAAFAQGPLIIQLGRDTNRNGTPMVSLRLLDLNKKTGIMVWALAFNNNICGVPYGRNSVTFVNFVQNPKLLSNYKATKTILENATKLHSAKCPSSTFPTALAISTRKANMSLVENALFVVTHGYVVSGGTGDEVLAFMDPGGYSNKVAAKYQSDQVAAQRKRQQEIAQRNDDQKAQAFADKYDVSSGWVDWQRLETNPFSYEGMTLVFNAKFERMISPTSGIFSGEVFTNIPRNTFIKPTRVLLAGKVVGTITITNSSGGEVSVPKVKYLGHIKCRDSKCGGYFQGHIKSQ